MLNRFHHKHGRLPCMPREIEVVCLMVMDEVTGHARIPHYVAIRLRELGDQVSNSLGHVEQDCRWKVRQRMACYDVDDA